MNNIVPFVPIKKTGPSDSLKSYIDWAKSQISAFDLPSEPMKWEAKSWSRWGFSETAVTKLGDRSAVLNHDFIDFAKAYVFERRIIDSVKGSQCLLSLRCLEFSLLSLTGTGDIKLTTSAILDKSCNVAQEKFVPTTAYIVSKELKKIYLTLINIGVLSKTVIWEPQIKPPKVSLKESEAVAEKKLPSENSLIALGEIFHSSPGLPLDIMTTSAVALLLSHPSRIGELKYVRKDCLSIEIQKTGREQLYINWFSNKNYGASKKIVPDEMAQTVKEAVNRIIKITAEAREYAKWLEDNPNRFPYHAKVPNKDIDEPLTAREACEALMLSTEVRSPGEAFRQFMKSLIKGKKVIKQVKVLAENIFDAYGVKSNFSRFTNNKFIDTRAYASDNVTLRVLNEIVRGRYLTNSFPYTDENKVTKFKDALFCFRTGQLSLEGKVGIEKPFGLKGCDGSRLGPQLTGNTGTDRSIFERHGYLGVSVNSHAFRHFLNTAANRKNLSQELIARWSGRLDISQNKVYNHVSAEEKANEISSYSQEITERQKNTLSSFKNRSPVTMSDIGFEGDRIVHSTEFGICIHDYAQEPCAKFNNCLTCGEHVCVKGDKVKLNNIKEEKEYLKLSLNKYEMETNRDTYGANTWLNSTKEKITRCEQLIDILENSDIEDGAIVKGVENGWTAGSNALSMRGVLIEKS